jgi:hypothetical protein
MNTVPLQDWWGYAQFGIWSVPFDLQCNGVSHYQPSTLRYSPYMTNMAAQVNKRQTAEVTGSCDATKDKECTGYWYPCDKSCYSNVDTNMLEGQGYCDSSIEPGCEKSNSSFVYFTDMEYSTYLATKTSKTSTSDWAYSSVESSNSDWVYSSVQSSNSDWVYSSVQSSNSDWVYSSVEPTQNLRKRDGGEWVYSNVESDWVYSSVESTSSDSSVQPTPSDSAYKSAESSSIGTSTGSETCRDSCYYFQRRGNTVGSCTSKNPKCVFDGTTSTGSSSSTSSSGGTYDSCAYNRENPACPGYKPWHPVPPFVMIPYTKNYVSNLYAANNGLDDLVSNLQLSPDTVVVGFFDQFFNDNDPKKNINMSDITNLSEQIKKGQCNIWLKYVPLKSSSSPNELSTFYTNITPDRIKHAPELQCDEKDLRNIIQQFKIVLNSMTTAKDIKAMDVIQAKVLKLN